jgi:predicted permease
VAHALGELATLVLVPALLFRTMARLDLAQMPWTVAQAYFVPALAFAVAVWAAYRRRSREVQGAAPARAAGATLAVAATYGNAVQLGIPMALTLFGERGLAIHLALVSLHGIIVLTVLTVLAESDLARGQSSSHAAATLRATLRSTLTHPVVLPILLGLAFNLSGVPLPALADQLLMSLGSASVPLCLLLIGMNLAQFGLRSYWRGALLTAVLKLVVLPAVVLFTARALFGLQGLALQVAVMMAALPVGVNALIFAQRYRVMQAEATAAIVLSTMAFALTAPLWLWLLHRLA